MLLSGSTRDFSGVDRVISSFASVDRNLVPAVTGLNFLMAIVGSSAQLVELDAVALGERHHRLLERGAPSQVPAHPAP